MSYEWAVYVKKARRARANILLQRRHRVRSERGRTQVGAYLLIAGVLVIGCAVLTGVLVLTPQS